MLASQRSLAEVQLNRNTVAEVAESRTPLREAALKSFRRRNAVLDAMFYDVGTVTAAEAQDISPWLAREGSLLIVPPTGQGPLCRCGTIDGFAGHGGTDIRILTVAGVGSSALGSAAFARNVADAFGQPVAAVVSGYGLADLLTEAAGGWFFFGTLNRLRHQFEELDRLSRTLNAPETAAASEEAAAEVGISLARTSLDTATVISLLADPRFKFSLLAGHSKGNLVISEALFELKNQAETGGAQPAEEIWIVTVSAAVAMPPRYRRIVDVMGAIDWFGRINSTPGIEVDKLWPLSWHHTNTELSFHLPVTTMFRELIADRGIVV